MAEEAIGNFNLLPLEIVSQIVELIPFCEKKKARLVCPRLRVMIDSPRSVAFRPKLTNNISMKYFLNSYCSMDNVIIRNINKRKSKNVFGNLEFPRVKNAELGWKNSEGNIERFLTQGCEYAESLTLAKFSLERISRGAISKILSEIPWKNLTRLKVETSSLYLNNTGVRKHVRNLTIVLKYARIPTLKELDFHFDFRGAVLRKRLQCQKLFMGLYVFLVGHSKTLKMLTGWINTGPEYTLEIPEIPMDHQQTLISNMKLTHFSLSILCHEIRRYESIFNPTVFGTELKNLDIKIEKPRFSNNLVLPSWNLFERNLDLLFERNGKSLTNVSLNLPVFHLNLIAKCAALETLKLAQIFWIVDPDDLSRLSHIKLKSFSLRHMYYPGSSELFQLLHQSLGTLEHLDLYNTPDTHLLYHRHPIQVRLRDFVSLKSMKIVNISPGYIEANMDVQFPHLTELETFLTAGNLRMAATWITESMRNLEMITITITGPCVDIQLLQTLFTLTKLKRIIFDDATWNSGQIEEIKEFCAANQVTFTSVDGRKIGHAGDILVITLKGLLL